MVSNRRNMVARLLSRLLVPGRGEVRALEEALHLEGVLRFVALFMATIVLPSILLAYFGVTSIRVEGSDSEGDLHRQAEGLADAFWSLADRRFSGFEVNVRDRLEAGRSPIDSPKELQPHLLVALRFDENGRLVAPFAPPDRDRSTPLTPQFASIRIEAITAERKGVDLAKVAYLYGRAMQESSDPATRGRAAFDRARVLGQAGHFREAMDGLAEVRERYADLRDPWGFRLGDLARIEEAELRLKRNTDEGVAALRNLVDDLLRERWTVGEGGEAAIARRALSLLEPYGEKEWTATARGRVAERSSMLYWADLLLPEFERVAGSGRLLRVDAGQIRWIAGPEALWATTWWDGDLYAFGLDIQAILKELEEDARSSVRHDSPVVAHVAGPQEEPPEHLLVRRSLSPWLVGWSLVVTPSDPTALAADRARRRAERIGVIVVAVGMIGLGAVLTVRLVKRELDVARMKTDFAANVSHELRSPITQIRLKGESLLLGLADSDEEREAAYQAIVRESERLSRLVDNVLDFAAIERGAKRYTLVPGDLGATAERAVASIRAAQELADKRIAIEIPEDLPPVWHDADAIAQCVVNLVSNAAKYSGPGARITVRCREVEEGVELSVSDEGIGIASEELGRVFEPFYRSGDNRARRKKGTGIGLTITRYIMEAHGGRISVQSRLGHGSTFSLLFPRKPPSGTALAVRRPDGA